MIKQKHFKAYKTYDKALKQALKLRLSKYSIVKDIRGLYFIHTIGLEYYRG